MNPEEIKMRFERAWRSIARIDAHPQLKISLDDPNAREIAAASLAAFAGQEEVLIDSASLATRPIRIRPASSTEVFDLCSEAWEFVVLREKEHGYWAISEEEHEWLVFTANEKRA